MSVPSSQIYIPATQVYNRMEPAFASCENGTDYTIPFALGAISKAIQCQTYRPDGQCWGTFFSKDVDTTDIGFGCIQSENHAGQICKSGMGTVSASSSASSSALSSASPQPMAAPKPNFPTNQAQLRTLKNYAKMHPEAKAMASATAEANPQAANLFMSYDVFDTPFLRRGVQSQSDPAGWLTGVPTYNNLMQRAEASTATANEPWGACSSYGNYSSAPNATLTSNNTCGVSGNCVLGQYAA